MPNYCSNYATLRHDDYKMITRAKTAFKDRRLLDEFIPVPKELTDTMAGSYGDEDKQQALLEQTKNNREKFGYGNWYDFCIGEWGTKWDVGDEHGVVAESDHELTVSFESAWAPPLEAYNKLLDLGFDVVAFYYEPGMAFAGKYDNGDDDYYEIGGETSKTIRDTVGDEIDDMFGISECMAEYEQEEKDEVTVWYEDGVKELKLEDK